MADVEVLVVGAGPTGLTMALEIARREHPVRIVDRLAAPFPGSRGKGLSARSLEVLDDLGVVDEARASGFAHLPHRVYRAGELVYDADPYADRVPTPDMPYESGLIIPQWRTEQILRHRLAEYGVHVERATELTGFRQRPDRVEAALGTGEWVTAHYLVGCDGGRSAIRKSLEVRFDGESAPQGMVLGDVEVDGLAPERWYQWTDPERGFVALCPFRNCRSWQFQAVPFTDLDADGRFPEPSLDYFQRVLDDITQRLDGARIDTAAKRAVRLSSPSWLSTYRVNVRMVDRMRVGRVFLAGDAAHVHSPAGGLGMNTGIQDAYNLGWKLAAVLSGADERLLDTYQEERLPVAAWTLATSSAGLRRVAEQFTAENTRGIAAGASRDGHQLAIGYQFSSLSGRADGVVGGLEPGERAPDAPCRGRDGGAVRLFDVFRGPHATLLGFGDSAAAAVDRLPRQLPGGVRCRHVGSPGGTAVDLLDEHGHARSAYRVDDDLLVVVRPDGYCGFTAPPTAETAVRAYLARLFGTHPR
jgi:2-polyprenyl-6-methoxyphenol hydroxylase-like FAD-dependent oxidoreductase